MGCLGITGEPHDDLVFAVMPETGTDSGRVLLPPAPPKPVTLPTTSQDLLWKHQRHAYEVTPWRFGLGAVTAERTQSVQSEVIWK